MGPNKNIPLKLKPTVTLLKDKEKSRNKEDVSWFLWPAL